MQVSLSMGHQGGCNLKIFWTLKWVHLEASIVDAIGGVSGPESIVDKRQTLYL